MLFYFTGTGNCLSVARAIEERPVSIPQAIHQTPLTFSDEQIGIVALIYGHEMPTMVRQFLARSRFPLQLFLSDPDIWQPPRRCQRTGQAVL